MQYKMRSYVTKVRKIREKSKCLRVEMFPLAIRIEAYFNGGWGRKFFLVKNSLRYVPVDFICILRHNFSILLVMRYLWIVLGMLLATSLQAQTGIMTWKEQMEYVKQQNSSDSLGVVCTGYCYKGKIENEENKNELLERLFADSAMVVHYYSGCLYEIVPLKNLKQGPQGQTIEKNLAVLKSELQNIIVPEMVVIEIEWKFKGKKFTSEAIAWPKGSIVYDNIGTFVLGRTDKVEM